MVFYTAYFQRRRSLVVTGPNQISVELLTKLFVAEEWATILRGKNDMKIHLYQRLRHHMLQLV